MARDTSTTNCGNQHLKLAGMIIGLVVMICVATVTYTQSTLRSIEARVRIVEQNDAANAARFESLRAQMQRIERAIEKSAFRSSWKSPHSEMGAQRP
jgi:hypothetical protein